MKKILFSLLLTFSLALPASASFSDVPFSHENYQAISYMELTGTISGYSDGTFRPYSNINRAEILKILITSNNEYFKVNNYYQSCFIDVKSTNWFSPYICYAKAKGWVKGYSDNSFHPSGHISRAEAIKLILYAYLFDVPESVSKSNFDDVPVDAWYAPYVQTAYELDLIEPDEYDNFYPGNMITRAEVAQIIYNAINVGEKDEELEQEDEEDSVSGEVKRNENQSMPI